MGRRKLYPDMTVGSRWGKLVCLERIDDRSWAFKCDCGEVLIRAEADVRPGKILDCGCHRLSKSHPLTYDRWQGMMRRAGWPCAEKREDAHNYVGRGITVCERWRLFKNFFEDMGECPEGLTLDRFPDNDGNYEPGNCRWATWDEQAANRRPRKGVTNGQDS